MKWGCRTVIVAAVALLLGATGAWGAPGQIDPGFGRLGNGTVPLHNAFVDGVTKLLRQSDGKIVTMGDNPLVLTRRDAHGTPDPTFGSHGVVVPASLAPSHVTDAALQPDGKIVLAGITPTGHFFVTRLRADGTTDPSFDAQQPANVLTNPTSVAVGPSGAIVLASASRGTLVVARYTSTGALDTTFSGDGIATATISTHPVSVDDMIVQTNGAVVVLGTRTYGGVFLRRFDANGTLDNTFISAPTTAPAAGVALVQQGSGFVVAGWSFSGYNTLLALARFTATGALDPAFGDHGVRIAGAGFHFTVEDLLLDNRDRLVAVGTHASSDIDLEPSTNAMLFRFSPSGSLDTTFGCNGHVVTGLLGNGAGTPYGSSAARSGVIAGNDIVIGGYVRRGYADEAPTDAFLAAYESDGPTTHGYTLVRADGGMSAFGAAPPCGSAGNSMTVGGASLPGGRGGWTVGADGGVFNFGNAQFYGSLGALRLAQPIVGMAAAPDGHGYWLVARDGGVFAFGSARFYGSTGNIRLAQAVVGMAAAPDGHGYWLVARDGGVFAFGSARFLGSMGGRPLHAPVVGMTHAVNGRAGYWLVASDGGIFSFGAARFTGSTGATQLAQAIVGMAPDPDGTGYWLVAHDGGVFAFAAPFLGSTGATPFPVGPLQSTVGIAATP